LAVLSVTTVLLALRPPPPVAASAAAAEFSAGRALPHVQTLAERPRPVGTSAHSSARDYLVSGLDGLGWPTQVLTGTVANPRLGPPIPVGRVNTVVATLPGRAPTGTVYLTAHYDSVRIGPGANDNAVAVAALLEVARALTAGQRPRNTVMLLFTDGEEDGLLGARQALATLDIDPRSSMVVNFDARGSHGPLIAFETSDGNADILAGLAQARLPLGFSLGYEVYRRLPHDTDFTEFRRAGIAGVNLAYLDGSPRYHTASDVYRQVDPATVQHAGELALRLARTFGDADLTRIDRGQRTFFWIPGQLVRYPNALALPLAIAAALAVVGHVLLARRRGALRLGHLGLASVSFLAPVLAGPVLAVIGWSALRALHPGNADLFLGDPYRPGWARAGFAVLGLTAVLTWYGSLRRRLGPATLDIAVAAWLAALGLPLAVAAPGGAYLFSLPALVASAAGIAAFLAPDRPSAAVWRPVAHAVSAVITALIAVPVIALLLPTLGLAGAAVPVLLIVLLAGPALPLIEAAVPLVRAAPSRLTASLPRRLRGWSGAGVAGGAMVLLLLTVDLVVDRFDEVHPRPASLVYAWDADTRTAQWLSADRAPSEWTTRFAGGAPVRVADRWPNLTFARLNQYRTGPAEAADLAAPELVPVELSAADGGRTLRLRLRSVRGAPVISVRLAADAPALASATVDGVSLPVRPAAAVGGWGWGFVINAVPPDGVEVRLQFATTAPVRVRVVDEADGLAGLPGFSPRPPGLGLSLLPTDITCVGRTVTL
ncbi:MAG: M20/M25/M40 family metallo-hydrolase, partial [Micromonosporaceae bacterium]